MNDAKAAADEAMARALAVASTSWRIMPFRLRARLILELIWDACFVTHFQAVAVWLRARGQA